MLKFAFIANMPGEDPEQFSATYENAESCNYVVGVDNMDEAKACVKKLAADGYTLLNLCGAFDDEITAELQQIAGADVAIKNASYTDAEGEKADAVDPLEKYGVLVVMRGVETPQELVVNGKVSMMEAIFVKDLAQAEEAAKKMVADGIQLIELCSWFDKEKMEAVIAAIGGAVPVGTCGAL